MSKLSRNLKILFHAEGDSRKGTGHLVRSLGVSALLKQYVEKQNIPWIIYSANSNSSLDAKIRKDWKDLLPSLCLDIRLPDSIPQSWEDNAETVLNELLSLQEREKFDVLITDGKFPWSVSNWIILKENFKQIICIDNTHAVNEIVDHIIFSADYFDKNVIESKFQDKVHTGLEWVWVHPGVQKAKDIKIKKYDFCIQMGGADPKNLSILALKDLCKRGFRNTSIVIILGPEYHFDSELHEFIRTNKINAEVVRMANDFHKIIAASRVLLCAFGLIVVEAELLKVFSILYSHNPEHLEDTLTYYKAHKRNAILRDEWVDEQKFTSEDTLKVPNILHENIFYLINEFNG